MRFMWQYSSGCVEKYCFYLSDSIDAEQLMQAFNFIKYPKFIRFVFVTEKFKCNLLPIMYIKTLHNYAVSTIGDFFTQPKFTCITY